jgi:hypothetical protein
MSVAQADRDLKTGRFGPGNQAAKGNRLASKAAQLRLALLEAVSAEDIEAIVKRLIEQAKGGDTKAIRELFNRTLGPPIAVDVFEKLDELEQILKEVESRG